MESIGTALVAGVAAPQGSSVLAPLQAATTVRGQTMSSGTSVGIMELHSNKGRRLPTVQRKSEKQSRRLNLKMPWSWLIEMVILGAKEKTEVPCRSRSKDSHLPRLIWLPLLLNVRLVSHRDQHYAPGTALWLVTIQSLSHVRLLLTPRTVAHQVFSSTIERGGQLATRWQIDHTRPCLSWKGSNSSWPE